MNFVGFIGFVAVVLGKYIANITASPSLPTMNTSSSTTNGSSSTMNAYSSTMYEHSSTMFGYSSTMYVYPSTINSFLSPSSPSTTTMNVSASASVNVSTIPADSVVMTSSEMHTGLTTRISTTNGNVTTKHTQPSGITTRRLTSTRMVTTKSCSQYPFGLTQALSNALLYAALSLAGICIILLIIVCCCCNYKIKKLRRQLEQNATRNVNSHVNRIGSDVVSFPSPMQLQTFGRCNTDGPPEQQEEPKYVTVVNGNDNDHNSNDNDMEQQYSTVTRDDELPNNKEGKETRDPESPLYSNASAFPFVDDSDTYEQLMSRDRDEVGHYTSLIRKKENNEVGV